MAQRAGRDFQIALINGYDIRPTMAELPTFRREKVIEDTTVFGIDDQTQAPPGMRRAALSESGFYNDTALSSLDALLSTYLNDTPVSGMVGLSGNAPGAPVTMFNGMFAPTVGRTVKVGAFTRINADFAITNSGGTTLAVDEGTLIAAQQTATVAGSTQSVDAGEATANGATAYLHVVGLALGGYTSWSVIVEHSSDNVTWTTLLTFANVTAAPSTNRQVAVGAVNRFLRATLSLNGAGAGPSITFAVGVTRNVSPGIGTPAVMTLGGGLITDTTRAAGTPSDGAVIPGGVGIYPAATNQVLNSGAEVDGTTGVSAVSAATITRTTVEHKFGVASFQIVTPNATTGEGVRFSTATGLALAAGTNVFAGMWIKGAGNWNLSIRITNTDATTLDLLNVPVTATGTWTYYQIGPVAVGAGKTGDSYAVSVRTNGQQGVTAYIDGIEGESSTTSFVAAPHISTTGTAQTRTAGRVQGPAIAANAAQMWIAYAFKPRFPSTQTPGNGANTARHFDWRVDSSNFVSVSLSETSLAFLTSRQSAGVGTSVASAAQTFVVGDTFVVIGEYLPTSVLNSVAKNAGAIATVAQAQSAVPAGMPVSFDIGSVGGGTSFAFGTFLWFAMGTGTLTAADRTALAAYTATIPLWATLAALNGGASGVALLWAAADATASINLPRAERPAGDDAPPAPTPVVPAPPTEDSDWTPPDGPQPPVAGAPATDTAIAGETAPASSQRVADDTAGNVPAVPGETAAGELAGDGATDGAPAPPEESSD